MIGNPKWFERRKYGGWGITPKTWQGWVYIGIMVIPFAIFQSLPFWDNLTRLIIYGIWMLVLIIDILSIMKNLDKDEREEKIEALAERNSTWAMIAVLLAGILYQTYLSAFSQTVKIDWFLVATLAAGTIVKSLSNFILEKKDL
ncbi:hypothetical protein GYA19_03025 [Candidatus Beckwithbacteria bacterium]|nr:hypothetical protein [Candidatus Beckwithbacteria bacterium]